MTKELSGLGSGALREALCEALDCIDDNIDLHGTEWADRPMTQWMSDWRLSLSSPIEPTSVEHGVTVDYVAGQEREAASARLVARERGYTIPDDWTSQEVIRHITGWPAQPSQASSEIREARVAALNEAIDAINSVRFVFQRSSWADALEKVMELRDRALAPSRQGAGGK